MVNLKLAKLEWEDIYDTCVELKSKGKTLLTETDMFATALGLTVRQIRSIIVWYRHKEEIEDVISKIGTKEVNEYVYNLSDKSKKKADMVTAGFILSHWPNDPFDNYTDMIDLVDIYNCAFLQSVRKIKVKKEEQNEAQ